MGHTITEKILGKACGKDVIPGEIVNVRIDKLMTMDFFASIVGKLYDQLEAPALFDPDMVVVFCDHMGPGHSLKDAELLKQTREFVKKYNLKNFYDLGRNGICHQMMVENGYVKPGKVVVGTDSHSPTYGAMGAFACGVTSSEAAVIMATGEIWFRVPSSVKVELKGKLQPGCCGKDVSLKIMSLIGFDKTALYKAIEITGEGIASLEIADRLTITNMMAETGAKSAIIHADEKTIRYLQDIGADDGDYECYESDSDATYDDEYVINLDELEPTVAIPHSSDLIKKAEELEGTPIHHVFVGSCTNGRLEDIKDAADILRGHKIADDVRMIVVPASQHIYLEALKKGYIQDLIEAGALVESSSCASCAALHTGILPSGEIAISTTNRNFKGRMGSKDASIYLASAATAAAAARCGYITDPRKFMN